MNMSARLMAVILFFSFASCQKRTVCKIKTGTGGTAFTRIYANTYKNEEEYTAAIAQLKTAGYSCDDSTAIM